MAAESRTKGSRMGMRRVRAIAMAMAIGSISKPRLVRSASQSAMS